MQEFMVFLFCWGSAAPLVAWMGLQVVPEGGNGAEGNDGISVSLDEQEGFGHVFASNGGCWMVLEDGQHESGTRRENRKNKKKPSPDRARWVR